jgi:hypothetical protein
MFSFLPKPPACQKTRSQTAHNSSLDRALLTQEVGKLSKRQLDLILSGIDIVLGR